MVKRPLLVVLSVYVLGCLLAWWECSWGYAIAMLLIACVVLFILVLSERKAERIPLFFLPFLFILGYLAMRMAMEPPEMEAVFDAKAACKLTGIIEKIVNRTDGCVIYVKNNKVYLSSEEDPYEIEKIMVYCSNEKSYQVGNQIAVLGNLQKFSVATNPGQFHEKRYYQIQNIDYKVMADEIHIMDPRVSFPHSFLDPLKMRMLTVYDQVFEGRNSGTITAMLLGEKHLLDAEVKKLYQENGVSHILAISGLHVTLLGMAIYQLLIKMRLPIPAATVVAIMGILSYGVLTNFSISTNRAVVMLIVMLFARIFGKTYDIPTAAALSAFLILLKNPMQLLNAGFLLSYGAVLGIANFYPIFQELFPKKHFIINSIFASFSAQVLTVPVVVIFFYQMPLYSVFINLLIIPCMTILVLTAFIAGLVGIVHLPSAIFLMGGANYILKFYDWICIAGRRLPYHIIPVGKPEFMNIVLYFFLILGFVWIAKKQKKKEAVLLIAFAFGVLLYPKNNQDLEITMLDVGQGDAIFIKSDTNTTYLMDGGSSNVSKVGEYRILPYLKAKGIGTIDYVIVTHPDRDHISGITELIEETQMKIVHLVLPHIDMKMEAYLELEILAKQKGITMIYMGKGDKILDGNMRLTCLHPYPEFPATNNNSYSLVFSLSYGEFDMLFTGDLEEDGERLINQIIGKEVFVEVAKEYDVLKVAHHGSKNSTSEEFLAIIKPEFSLISCGEDNSYGHPHEELLDRLIGVESNIKITYECGAIIIKTDGKKMYVKGYME